ncbi:MAG: hypothetical protein JSV17_07340 [Candidatus Aminicenantes bacterium]|nr:MAG: hypothetical protein JSV17_07340 [Candidatus Aminicenantes bacterium]
MELNTKEVKRICIIGIGLLVSFCFFSHSFWLFPNNPQTSSQEEQMVRETLDRFQEGIEKGDLEVGPQITTEDFYPFFKGFYESLAKVYSQYKILFPMEIGHLKILRSGKAKVELYINPAKNLFIFTLKKENDQWKISHNESIRFPLYSVPELPYKDVYEIPTDKKNFMTAEIELNFMTRVYFTLKEQQGQEKAVHFFLDGPGYKVAMDAWLPFLEGAAQFAYYFVIMESNFYGSECEVIQADYDEAEVFCSQLAALEVLKRGHAVPKFSYAEYTRLLTTIMEHRAKHCGLDLELSFENTSCRIKIKRS